MMISSLAGLVKKRVEAAAAGLENLNPFPAGKLKKHSFPETAILLKVTRLLVAPNTSKKRGGNNAGNCNGLWN